jgi:cytochrome c biogenesis factor
MSTLGTLGLLAAWVLLLTAWGLTLAVSVRRKSDRIWLAAQICFYASSTLLLWCSTLLTVALLLNDTSIDYVARQRLVETDWYDRLLRFGEWGDGSFLLWALLIAVFAGVVLSSVVREAGESRSYIQRQITFISVTLLAPLLTFIIFWVNPFAPADSNSVAQVCRSVSSSPLTEALRNMSLLGGYAALAMVFGLALSGLAEPLRWLLYARWTRIAWMLIVLGIGLGMLSADRHPGWVEHWSEYPSGNGVLTTWFICSAMLHATHNRQASDRVSLLLAGAGFAAAVLSMFLSAAPMSDCRHGFAVSPAFFALPAGPAAVAAVTFARSRRLPSRKLERRSIRAALLILCILAMAVLAVEFGPRWGQVLGTSGQYLLFWSNRLMNILAVTLLAVLVWCGIAGVSRIPRERLECALSSATIASMVCFSLWLLGELGGGRLLAIWLATTVAGTVVFETVSRRSNRGSTAKMLAHLAIAVLAFDVAIENYVPTFFFDRTMPGRWTPPVAGVGIILLVAAGIVAAYRLGGQTTEIRKNGAG